MTTPNSIAVINNSISYYSANNIPTTEIQQTINWLKTIKSECDYKISRLENIEKERCRVKTWRKNLNTIAKKFLTDKTLNQDLEKRIKLVQSELNCEHKRAKVIAEQIQKLAKRRKLELRNETICYEFRIGTPVKEIAAKHKVSPQQIYNITKKEKLIL